MDFRARSLRVGECMGGFMGPAPGKRACRRQLRSRGRGLRRPAFRRASAGLELCGDRDDWLFQALPNIYPNDFGRQGPAPSSPRLQSFPLRQRVDQYIGRYGQFFRRPLTPPPFKRRRGTMDQNQHIQVAAHPPISPSVGAEVSDTRDLGPPLGGLFGPGTHRPIHRRSIGPFDQ